MGAESENIKKNFLWIYVLPVEAQVYFASTIWNATDVTLYHIYIKFCTVCLTIQYSYCVFVVDVIASNNQSIARDQTVPCGLCGGII
jgi:hypothetical protein